MQMPLARIQEWPVSQILCALDLFLIDLAMTVKEWMPCFPSRSRTHFVFTGSALFRKNGSY